MSLFSTVKSVIKIWDWSISLGGKLKKKWKEFKQRRNEKKIDKAVDALDDDAVERILHIIKKKRSDRQNSS